MDADRWSDVGRKLAAWMRHTRPTATISGERPILPSGKSMPALLVSCSHYTHDPLVTSLLFYH
ncbi:Hypothetical protein SMAX5B_012731 [Scophthalmus maximus]|uniref:Uncharacterized protein n=1 Tax=Scophthalmus maximus TaxID=52904 RepID=A0A2U9BDE7_SCOMX|nr:Hypothetical protein SMAX5B_012731 [Scophthalmus maximus]